jgi:hypothetical protein
MIKIIKKAVKLKEEIVDIQHLKVKVLEKVSMINCKTIRNWKILITLLINSLIQIEEVPNRQNNLHNKVRIDYLYFMQI